MPQQFARVYTDEQRDALAHAFEDRRIRPAARVVGLAARGELEHNGRQLEPFKTNANTVRDLALALRRKRLGQKTSQLAQADPRDAVEVLRRRFVNLVDVLLADTEAQAKRDKNAVDPERLRQLARAAKEIAALPGPKDARPVASGVRKEDGAQEPQMKGGLGGKLLNAARRGDVEPAQSDTPRQEGPKVGDNAAGVNAAAGEAEGDEGNDVPGSLIRELEARVPAAPAV